MEDFKVKTIEENKSLNEDGEEIKIYSITLDKPIHYAKESYDTSPIESITIEATSKKDAEKKAFDYIESLVKN